MNADRRPSDVTNGIHVEVLLDSVGPNGARLTTFLVKYPRFVHADIMTHRSLARNGASSRAKPVRVVIREVLDDPAVPAWWASKGKGMQGGAPLKGWRLWLCLRLWLLARYPAVAVSWILDAIGAAKQHCNRVLEPWHHIAMLYSGTDHAWPNFFKLRCHPDADPTAQRLACTMALLYRESGPTMLRAGDWHMPFLFRHERDQLSVDECMTISVARCARLSYFEFDAGHKVSGFEADRRLNRRLKGDPIHATPFEHQGQAQPAGLIKRSGPFLGWNQHRKTIPGECAGEFDLYHPTFEDLCRKHGLDPDRK
jgi:hypothetical protein